MRPPQLAASFISGARPHWWPSDLPALTHCQSEAAAQEPLARP
jgi:hypothetical protein